MEYKKIQLKGKIYEVVTVSGLAEICSRSVNTIRKYEERNIIPTANLRLKASTSKEGTRAYTKKLALRLAEILQSVTQGVKISDEQQRQIHIAFQEEKIELTK